MRFCRTQAWPLEPHVPSSPCSHTLATLAGFQKARLVPASGPLHLPVPCGAPFPQSVYLACFLPSFQALLKRHLLREMSLTTRAEVASTLPCYQTTLLYKLPECYPKLSCFLVVFYRLHEYRGLVSFTVESPGLEQCLAHW